MQVWVTSGNEVSSSMLISSGHLPPMLNHCDMVRMASSVFRGSGGTGCASAVVPVKTP